MRDEPWIMSGRLEVVPTKRNLSFLVRAPESEFEWRRSSLSVLPPPKLRKVNWLNLISWSLVLTGCVLMWWAILSLVIRTFD